MEKCKQILKKLFFLPPGLTVLFIVLGFGAVILVFALDIQLPIVQHLAYIASAYAMVVMVTGFSHFKAFLKAAKGYINGHALMKKIRATTLGDRFFSDIRFRSTISIYKGLIINILYIAVKLFFGIWYRSVWFLALAIYYILLANMRFILLRRGKKRAVRMSMEEEIFRYRLCGILLLVMNEALVGIVIFIVYQNYGFDYPGLLIYAMAMYSFYAVITAAINVVKFRKHGSPLHSAAKVINLVAALVSLLSLETAMVARFGEDDEALRAAMTGATGGGVCIVVIGMAIFMIWNSTGRRKQLKIHNS